MRYRTMGRSCSFPRSGGSAPARPQRSLVWVDREGNAKPLALRPDDYTMARISPDGTRIALVVGSVFPLSDPPPDLYLFDLKTENLTQLTFDPQAHDAPVWSRDGARIFYRGLRDGVRVVYTIPSDGGTPELLARGDNPFPWSISADGKTLLLVNAPSLADINLATLELGKEDKVRPLLDLSEQLSEPSLSPSGQWLLYYEFGQSGAVGEVNIRPFPDVQQQRRPVGPGIQPVFSADGSEIFLFDGAGLSVAPVQYSPFRVGNLRKLFRGRYWYGTATPDGQGGRAWDRDPKNDRFLMITFPTADTTQGAPAQPEIDVVVNWLEELRQRVPTHRDVR